MKKSHSVIHRDKFANVQWRDSSNLSQSQSFSDRAYKSNPAAIDDSLGLRDPIQDLEKELKNSIGGHLKLDCIDIPGRA
jgi:hypothetical protein